MSPIVKFLLIHDINNPKSMNPKSILQIVNSFVYKST